LQGNTSSSTQSFDLESKLIPIFHKIKAFRSNYIDSNIPNDFINSSQLISTFQKDYEVITHSIHDLLKELNDAKIQFHEKNSNNDISFPVYSSKTSRQQPVLSDSTPKKEEDYMVINKYVSINEVQLMKDVSNMFKSTHNINDKVSLLQNLVSSIHLNKDD